MAACAAKHGLAGVLVFGCIVVNLSPMCASSFGLLLLSSCALSDVAAALAQASQQRWLQLHLRAGVHIFCLH
jgi:hypothetical protein